MVREAVHSVHAVHAIHSIHDCYTGKRIELKDMEEAQRITIE
jgi:hypothetical protein